MMWLSELLKKSRDFILVLDTSSTILQVGEHFHNALQEQLVGIAELSTLVRQQSYQLAQQGIMHLPLEKRNIFPSPFSVLHQDDQIVVLLATDRKPYQALISHLRQSRDREEVFREKNERVHILLDESSDPIFSFSADGTYLYINKVFADTIGRLQQDVIGKKIWDVFSKDEADRRFAKVQEVFQTGETGTIAVRVPLPGGGERFFLTTVKPVKDGQGLVSFVICISKDITELRQAREEIAVLRGIIPICASCKNIRDDAGYWQRIEDYVTSHSAAEFSHGLCPDCATKLYPEFVKDKSPAKIV
ncbi:MAG: PAS domain-containing protein [Desulforhopalus sp.]|nr:PAS domain-containing protein [Desulforhopalus sp.]